MALLAVVGCSGNAAPGGVVSIGDPQRDASADAEADAAMSDAEIEYEYATAPRTPLRPIWVDTPLPQREPVNESDSFDASRLYVVLSWENADYEESLAVAPWDELETYRFGRSTGDLGGMVSEAMIDPVAGELVYTVLDRDPAGVVLRRFRTDEGPLAEIDNDPETPLPACPEAASEHVGSPARSEVWLAPESGLAIVQCTADFEDVGYYTEQGQELEGAYGSLVMIGRNGLSLWEEIGGELYIVDAEGYAIQPIEPAFNGIWAVTPLADGFVYASQEPLGAENPDGSRTVHMSIVTLRIDGSVDRQMFAGITTDPTALLSCAFVEERALVCVDIRPHIYRETDEIAYYVHDIESGQLEVRHEPLPAHPDGTLNFQSFVAKGSL